GWTWCPLPQPDLVDLGSRARKWELSRYRAYQERLAGHDITETFTWCAEFLTLAASLAGDAGLPRSRTTSHAYDLDRATRDRGRTARYGDSFFLTHLGFPVRPASRCRRGQCGGRGT